MSAIGVGDWVECIRVLRRPPSESAGYGLGELCRVEEVGGEGSGAWINCEGKKTPAECGLVGRGWAADCFRPIYTPKQSIIEALKAPPQRVGEPA